MSDAAGGPTAEPTSLRVLLVAESSLPYLSGVTISTDALARGLRAAGHDVLLMAPRPADPSAPIPPAVDGPDYERHWLASYQLPRLVPAGYRMPWPRFGRAVRAGVAFAPDVVHAQSPFVTGRLARTVARRSGAHLVFTHHTRFADYRHYLGPLSRGPLGRAWGALLERHLDRFWRSCDAIVAPSSDLAAEIEPRLPAVSRGPRLAVIPTGIDVASIRRLPRADPHRLAGWPADSVVAASLGRLAPEKSVGLLLDAFELAAAAAPALRLLLIGGGPSEARLRARVASGPLSGRVHLTGHLPRSEALTLLGGADLFAFASRTETQGLVLAEALARGLPVVALDGPAIRDTVRDGADGLVVPADPARDRRQRLGDALAALAGDSPRRARLAQEAARGADRFDVALRTRQMVDLYRILGSETRAGPWPAAPA